LCHERPGVSSENHRDGKTRTGRKDQMTSEEDRDEPPGKGAGNRPRHACGIRRTLTTKKCSVSVCNDARKANKAPSAARMNAGFTFSSEQANLSAGEIVNRPDNAQGFRRNGLRELRRFAKDLHRLMDIGFHAGLHLVGLAEMCVNASE
jgi:hypothetical protein